MDQIPKEHRAAVTARIERVPGVLSCRFTPKERFDFLPGQFGQLTLTTTTGEPLSRYLSFSAPPGLDYVEMTKKISESDFSRRFAALEAGEEVVVEGPRGSCVFEGSEKKIGFLIGGIGITPVMAILEHIAGRKLETDAVLLYSNRTLEDTAFRQRLSELSELRPKLRVHCFLTRAETVEGGYRKGRIDGEAVAELIPDLRERTIYIYGPPRMVDSMNTLCVEAGCEEERLKTESFAGY